MRYLSVLAAAVGLVAAAPTASATAIATITDSSDGHTLTIPDTTSDVPFSFHIVLTADFATVSAELKVQDVMSAGVFELTGGAFNAAAGWDDSLPPLTTTPDLLNAGSSSNLSQDIGTLVFFNDQFQPIPVPAGTARFVTIDAIVKAGTPAGTYPLNLAEIIVGDTSFVSNAGTPGEDYVVEVTPEPATLLLLSAGGLLLRRRTRA